MDECGVVVVEMMFIASLETFLSNLWQRFSQFL